MSVQPCAETCVLLEIQPARLTQGQQHEGPKQRALPRAAPAAEKPLPALTATAVGFLNHGLLLALAFASLSCAVDTAHLNEDAALSATICC